MNNYNKFSQAKSSELWIKIQNVAALKISALTRAANKKVKGKKGRKVNTFHLL